MEISKIDLRAVNHPFIVANGEIQFDNFLCIAISIKKRKDGGIYVSWPQHVGKDNAGADKWYNDVSFINKDDQPFADANKKAIDGMIMEHFNSTMVKEPPKKTTSSKPIVVVKMKQPAETGGRADEKVSTEVFMSEEDRAFEEELFQED